MNAATPPSQDPSATRMSLRDALDHARSLQQRGDYDASAALCEHILGQIPDQPNALQLLAGVLHLQGRPAEAVVRLERLVGQLPGDAGIRVDLANLLIEAGQFDAASQHLQQALGIDPASAIAWNSQAVACLRTGRLDDCEVALMSGLELEPERDDLLCNLGLLRDLQGRTDEAIELHIGATEREPQQPARWSGLAELLMKAERWNDAAEAWRRRLSVGAPSAVACNRYALALLRCGELEDGEAALRQGLELDPQDSELNHSLAHALQLAGRHRESIELAQAVLAREPDSGPLRRMMSESHLALGEREAAVELLRQWQALDSDDPEPGRLLAVLEPPPEPGVDTAAEPDSAADPDPDPDPARSPSPSPSPSTPRPRAGPMPRQTRTLTPTPTRRPNPNPNPNPMPKLRAPRSLPTSPRMRDGPCCTSVRRNLWRRRWRAWPLGCRTSRSSSRSAVAAAKAAHCSIRRALAWSASSRIPTRSTPPPAATCTPRSNRVD